MLRAVAVAELQLRFDPDMATADKVSELRESQVGSYQSLATEKLLTCLIYHI